MSYAKFLAWQRLTHAGRRGREEMPPRAREEFDGLNFEEAAPRDPVEAKRLYEGVTAGGSADF
jgi:hypothetical protein